MESGQGILGGFWEAGDPHPRVHIKLMGVDTEGVCTFDLQKIVAREWWQRRIGAASYCSQMTKASPISKGEHVIYRCARKARLLGNTAEFRGPSILAGSLGSYE